MKTELHHSTYKDIARKLHRRKDLDFGHPKHNFQGKQIMQFYADLLQEFFQFTSKLNFTVWFKPTSQDVFQLLFTLKLCNAADTH